MTKKLLSILTLALLIVSQAFATCATVTVNGQCVFTDAAPTITLCGTTPTVATGGTSNGATITVGAAKLNAYGQNQAVLSCVATFATAFTHAPAVTVATNSLGFRVEILSVSTTALIVNFSGDAGGSKWSFVAF